MSDDQKMRIPLVDGWESQKWKTRVYPLSARDRAIVDETFDKLHETGRMVWADKPTLLGFPVFVVRKTSRDPKTGEIKDVGRAVVDICPLNKVSVKDSYPIPRQEDIIAKVRGKKFISVMDAASFFYQWAVHPDDWSKLAVNSHRGQEFFTVAVMGYCNSPLYVQRQADAMFRDLECTWVYIDDIVVASDTLEEHLQDLCSTFDRLRQWNVHPNPSKSYIGFPTAKLLGQFVDEFGLTTLAERVAAIRQLTLPETAQDLERYLGMANYLRHRVRMYAELTADLAKKKTDILKGAPIKGNQHKSFASRAKLDLTEAERAAWHQVQKALTTDTFCVHFDPARPAFVDMDASKRAFGAMVYHVRLDRFPEAGSVPPRTDVKPIMFLSKLMTPAETRYWPTEMEVAALVWVVRKIRHLIDGADKPVIVYTDHASTVDIVNHTHLGSSATDKLNLRLIRAAQYLSQFVGHLDVRHRPGKSNVVADALSRLPTTVNNPPEHMGPIDDGVLEELCVFHVATLHIEDSMRAELRAAYLDDPVFHKIWESAERGAAHHFYIDDSLLWNRSPLGSPRLCIPAKFERAILTEAHDDIFHQGFHAAYARIASTYYVRGLTKKLR